MNAVLVIVEGIGEGRRYFLPDGRSTSVGRNPENEIQIHGDEVSRLHCKIVSDGKGFRLVDHSSNGTYINGKRIKQEYLKNGDLIRLGSAGFKFLEEASTWGIGTKKESDFKFVPHLSQSANTRVLERTEFNQTSLMDTSVALADPEKYRAIHQNLATIYKVGNLINSIENSDELFNTLMDTIVEVINPERAFLLLTKEDSEEITPAVVRMKDEGEDGGGLTLSKTIVQDCIEKGLHILCPDAMMDDRFNRGESVFLNQIRSVMCVPLESQKRILGAIYVDSSQEAGAFSDRDLELLSAIGRQAGISIERTDLIQELEDLAVWSIHTLVSAIEAKDEYTRGHSERVSAFSVQLAEELGLGDRLIESIRLGGLLHDVGKIGVPEQILNKKGRLTDEEFACIKEHPVTGAHIIGQIHNPRMKHPIDIARHHHERWDGRGYPDNLKEKDIPFTARIVCVADSYDAMSTSRPYREPYPKEFIARQFIVGMGTQFDPEVSRAFLKIWQEGRLRKPKTLKIELLQARETRGVLGV